MSLGMRGRIEAIDLHPTVSSALLASVKALLEGDEFCRLKYWINGAEVTAGPRTEGCVCVRERQGKSLWIQNAVSAHTCSHTH